MKNLKFEFERYSGLVALGMSGKCADIIGGYYQCINSGAIGQTAELHWISGDETDKGNGFAYVILKRARDFTRAVAWGKRNVMESRPNGTKRAKLALNYRLARSMAARFIRENRPQWVGPRTDRQGFVLTGHGKGGMAYCEYSGRDLASFAGVPAE